MGNQKNKWKRKIVNRAARERIPYRRQSADFSNRCIGDHCVRDIRASVSQYHVFIGLTASGKNHE